MNVPISFIFQSRSIRWSIITKRWNFHDNFHAVCLPSTKHMIRSLSSNAALVIDSPENHHHNLTFDSGPLHDRYYNLISSDSIDPIQIRTLQALERLRYELLLPEHQPSAEFPVTSSLSSSFSSTLMKHTIEDSLTKFTNWFGLSPISTTSQQQSSSLTPNSHHHIPPPNIPGVYIHGGVGCGKTFLMNEIFYTSLDDTVWSNHRQKIHFHTFMLQVHQQMHMARKDIQQQQQQLHIHSTNESMHTHHHHHHDNSKSSGDAILDAVVSNIVQKGRLICFDEFQVTDVADALLLQRLFTSLWKYPNHCIVVATSNRSPDDLYLHGLQRDRFVPFIQQLKVYCRSVGMWESEQDYRLLMKQHDYDDDTIDNNINAASTLPPPNDSVINHETHITKSKSSIGRRVYFVGGKEVWKNYDRFFYRLVGKNKAVSPTTLQTQGRMVHIPQASLSKGICRFTFESLCTKALGASDYLVLGQHFHTVFVDFIPILKLEHINWVRRFIIFVDTMYECNCKLILHAKTEPKYIFQTGLSDDEIATTQIDEVFAFQRTVSRLHEMSSQTYLQKQQKLHPSAIEEDDNDLTKRVESKAALLSHRKAFVNYSPS